MHKYAKPIPSCLIICLILYIQGEVVIIKWALQTWNKDETLHHPENFLYITTFSKKSKMGAKVKKGL